MLEKTFLFRIYLHRPKHMNTARHSLKISNELNCGGIWRPYVFSSFARSHNGKAQQKQESAITPTPEDLAFVGTICAAIFSQSMKHRSNNNNSPNVNSTLVYSLPPPYFIIIDNRYHLHYCTGNDAAGHDSFVECVLSFGCYSRHG